MIKVFVDESGNLGKGGQYFVIALVVPQDTSRLENIITHHCIQYGHEESKASRLTRRMKQVILQKLCSKNDHEISYIVADKTLVQNPKLFEDKNILYNYLFQLLIKPIIQSSDEDIDILLDNHSIKTKSLNSLADYIKIKAYAEWGFRHNIEVNYTDSRKSQLVQMADIIANTVHAHYNFKIKGFYTSLKIVRSIKFPAKLFNFDV